MKVLWIFAHPEERSLNATLRDDGLRTLTELGHEYRVSDLYAMGWNPVVEADDFRQHDTCDRLMVASTSKNAYKTGRLREDIHVEQTKLRWADTVIVQFPFWWAGMPAILKGWFDRVFVKGFAYGVNDPDSGESLRYGNGGLAGKRAMVITTVGATEMSIGNGGIHGEMNDVMFSLQHGTLWYTGMSVVPPFVVPNADRLSDVEYQAISARLAERLSTIPTTERIPFRSQDSGDYDENLVLHKEIDSGNGLCAHYARPA